MNKFFYFLLILIVILGLALRIRNYSKVPFPGQSQDEYSNAWVGLSLIETGVPVGMSGVLGNSNRQRIYINPDHIFQQTAAGDPMTIVHPWFDHPPLVGLVTGAFAYWRGARLFEDVSASVIRKPAIFFAALTIFFIALVGEAWFGPVAGLLAAVFYAVSPLTTITNRMVQAENFLTPLALISLYCWWKFCHKRNRGWLYLGMLSIILAVLMKLSAVAFVIAGMALLHEKVKLKWPWILVGASGLATFSWFAIFGVSLNGPAFWSVLFSNSQRSYGIGYQAVLDLVTSFKITGRITLTDGWVLASFLGLAALTVVKIKNKEWVVYPFISYLAIYLFFGSESYGWYRIPFYPLTFLALGAMTVELVRRGEIGGLFFFLIPLGASLAKIIPLSGAGVTAWRMASLVVLFGSYFFNRKRLNQWLLVGFILIGVIAGVVYNFKIDTIFWQQLV